MKDPYITRCDKCGRGTWYETEQQCHMKFYEQDNCPTCGHDRYKDDPEFIPEQIRCTGTLRFIKPPIEN